jgi:Wiskott-Aldrich syndrome protein
MSSVSSFKFTKDGITRRVAFSANVTWSDIALKLTSLYNLPLEFIGASYIDSDGDEITISTQEELQDYYHFRGITASNEPLKFTVVDLRSLRAADSHEKPLPETPPNSHPLRSNPSRNTFGTIPFTYEEDEEWRRIPGFDQLFAPPTDSIRFVELASDAKSSLNDGSRKEGSSSGSVETANTARAKPQAGDDDISSIDSVIGNDTPKKHPVHVYDRSVPTPARESNSTTASSSATDAVPDPPLPDLEPGPTSISSPSLTNEVATLLSTITAAFSSHPELAESLRNILRHAGSESYWAARREQVSRAVEQIRRSSQDIHTQMSNAASTNFDAEHQAGRRIAEAVANIVRSLSQMASDPHNPLDPPSANHIPTPDFSFRTRGARVPPPPIGAHPPHLPRPPHLSHPPHPPPPHSSHPPHGYRSHPHFPLGPWGRHMPPHVPSAPWPLGRGWQGGPPVVPWEEWSESAQSPHPPLRSQPPVLDVSEDDSDDGQGVEISMYGISPQPSPRVQKEKLLAAKAAYIAEKQKYRQEKQARRREREGMELVLSSLVLLDIF